MQVKVGDMFFDAEDCPIMLILTDKDKENVANMLPEATKLCTYPCPEDCNLENPEDIKAWEEQIEAWMADTELPDMEHIRLPEGYVESHLYSGEFVERICLEIPTHHGRSKPWVECALRTWEDPPEGEMSRPERRAWRAAWRRRAIRDYNDRVGNPMIFMWIISMAFNAIFQWWLHRRREFEQAREDLLTIDAHDFDD